MIGMFKQITGVLEAEDRRNWTRVVVCGCIRVVIDIFSYYVTIYFISGLSADSAMTGRMQALVVVLMFFSEIVIELYRSKLSNRFLYCGAQRLSVKIFELFAKEDLEHHNKKGVMQAFEIVRNDTMKSVNIVLMCAALALHIITMAGYAAVLIFMSKWLGIGTCVIFALLIGGMFFWYRTQMKTYGERCRMYGIKANAQITLGYGIFEEMKISGHTEPVLEKYSAASRAYAKEQSRYSFKKDMIVVFMNLWTKAIMIIIFVSLFLKGTEISTFVPVTVYVSGLSRMASLAYSIVSELSDIEFSRKSYEVLKECLSRYEALKEEEKRRSGIRQKKMTFKKGLYVKDLTFGYDGQEKLFDHASMEIPAGCSAAVIGVSGAGKTTFLSLVLGLLKPQTGSVLYDDYDIVAKADGEGACRAEIGDIVSYIPQVVYMNGETVRNNVALLTMPDDIDEKRVEECLKCAQVWEDVEKMPEGMHTIIGENGTAISGGQRQRIALARALYHEFELLVMDEATAALDMETEKAVMDSIRQMRKDKTLLIVTHHMSLADECDMIYKIENQKLVRIR